MLGFSAFNCTYLTHNKAETRPDHPDPSLKTRTYILPAARLFTALIDVIQTLPRWKVVHQEAENGEISAERKTRLFGFIDDIKIRLTTTEPGKTTLNIKSASRVGKGDLGQNARNIREIFSALDHKIGKPSETQPTRAEPLKELSGRLLRHVQKLALEIGERNFTHPKAYQRAGEYIANAFKESGYEARFESFQIASPPALTALRTDQSNKVALKDATYRNVVAIKKGHSEEKIVIGAHYDTVIGTPGADDNASGVAVLLELARMLQGVTLEKTLLFAAFANEESPFFRTSAMGSAHFIKAHADEKITLMMSLEMLGFYSDAPNSQTYPPLLKHFYPDQANFIAVVGNLASKTYVNGIAKTMENATPLPVESLSAPRIVPGVDYSDQLNFWKAGIPAVMLTDTAFNRNPHYHKPSDLPQTLQYDKMADATTAILEALYYYGKVVEE